MPQSEILVQILSAVEATRANCEATNARTEKIEKILTGNGSPEKGLIVRFDRVERSQRIVKWFAGVSLVAILTAAADAIIKLL